MSISKLTSAILRQAKKPYTIIINVVLQKLKNGDALAVWCHLQSLPEDWVINKQYLMNHFDWGRDKVSSALLCLERHNLLSHVQERTEIGTFGKWFIDIKDGSEFIEHPDIKDESHPVDKKPKIKRKSITIMHMTPQTEKPLNGRTASGKTAATNTNTNIQIQMKRKNEYYPQKNEQRQTAPFWGKGHPDWERLYGVKNNHEPHRISKVVATITSSIERRQGMSLGAIV